MGMKKRVLVIFGTRPEVIKLAPVICKLRDRDNVTTITLNTGQHRDMVDPVLKAFNLCADISLDVMRTNQSLSSLLSRLVRDISNAIKTLQIQDIVVHGDTTTALAGALVGYYNNIPVAHVEAGLRTGQLQSPWPEEGNRKMIATIAKQHFAPTEMSRQNLLKENVKRETISVVGNTAIDAINYITNDELYEQRSRELETKLKITSGRKIVLVTGHRRESFGQGFIDICRAINKLIELHDEVYIIYPIHLNPNVREVVNSQIVPDPRIKIIEPLDYEYFSTLMRMSYLILTDSGGIQEEAPSLDKPVLVMRDTTERPEGVTAGCLKIVGTSTNSIVNNVSELLTNSARYEKMQKVVNPYGDGHASLRIAKKIEA